MALKKTNAVLALLTYLVLTGHVIYQVVSYIMFYYNAAISRAFADTTMLLFIAHAVIAFIILFGKHDSKEIVYKALNIRTLLQRIFAYAMCVLLPAHMFAFKIISQNSGNLIIFTLAETVQILFYLALFAHIALSFSNALITLGLMTDMKKKKITDVVMAVICSLFFIVSSVVVVVTHWNIHHG